MQKYAGLAIPKKTVEGLPFFYKKVEVPEGQDGHPEIFLEFLRKLGIDTSREDIYSVMSEIGWVATLIIGEHEQIATFIPADEMTPHQITYMRRLKKFFSTFDTIEVATLSGDFYQVSDAHDKEEFLDSLYNSIEEYYKQKMNITTIK